MIFLGKVTAGMGGGKAFTLRPGVEKDLEADENALLWRYVKKRQFIDLLRTQSLFFTRLTTYLDTDPLEGSSPHFVPMARESFIEAQGGDVAALREQGKRHWQQFLQIVLVSCWHKHDVEAKPMWDRYGNREEAVAIVSTLGRLKSALPERADVGR